MAKTKTRAKRYVSRSPRWQHRAKYEYQSDFAKRYFAEGRAEGKAEGEARGRAAVLIKLLTLKFGSLTLETTERVQHASAEELDRWAERILSAATLDDVLS